MDKLFDIHSKYSLVFKGLITFGNRDSLVSEQQEISDLMLQFPVL